MRIFKPIDRLSDKELNEAIDQTNRAILDLIDQDEPERKDLLDRLNALTLERIKRKLSKAEARRIEKEEVEDKITEPKESRERPVHYYILDTVDGRRRRLSFNHPLEQIIDSFVLADRRNPDGWIETSDGDRIHSGKIIYFSKIREEG